MAQLSLEQLFPTFSFLGLILGLVPLRILVVLVGLMVPVVALDEFFYLGLSPLSWVIVAVALQRCVYSRNSGVNEMLRN
jgi:hypothetical protein